MDRATGIGIRGTGTGDDMADLAQDQGQRTAEQRLTERLAALRPARVDLGLDRMERLLAALGNPQGQVPIAHVAGTNGKGSTCAAIAAIASAAGYRTGRYTSPHLVSWTERICIDGAAIAPTVFLELLEEVLAASEALAQEDEALFPTQFELVTAVAWLHFARQGVDLAVMEVGLGGRLDATNVCDRPLVTAIVSISRDHWQVLGDSIAAIATEKAGIMKANVPTVIGPLPPAARKVVRDRAAALPCPMIEAAPAVPIDPPRDATVGTWMDWVEASEVAYPLALTGQVQRQNSAVAIAMVQQLQAQGFDRIDTAAIQTGMAQVTWPGRMQWVTWRNRLLLVDGAHNRDAADALRLHVDGLMRGETAWVMGVMATKDYRGLFESLLRPDDRLYLVPIPDHAGMDPKELAAIALEICPELRDCQTFDDLDGAIAAAFTPPPHTTQDPELQALVVLCGSLYLIGQFLGDLAQTTNQL